MNWWKIAYQPRTPQQLWQKCRKESKSLKETERILAAETDPEKRAKLQKMIENSKHGVDLWCRLAKPSAYKWDPVAEGKYSDGEREWNVSSIIEHAKDLPSVMMDVEELVRKNGPTGTKEGLFSDLVEKPNAAFRERCEKADLRYPILVDSDGWIIDGSHRLAKAKWAGRKQIMAKVVDPSQVEGSRAKEAMSRGIGQHSIGKDKAGDMNWRKQAQQKNSYFFRGANPTVDLVALKRGDRGMEILLILRGGGTVEGGKWALPGGFIDTDAKRGEEWKPGKESPRQAAARETAEETGVRVDPGRLVEIGVFEGNGRDPRDNDESWSKSHAFAVIVDGSPRARAGDDAKDARWFPVSEIPSTAFDHGKIIQAGLSAMGSASQRA